MIFSRCGAHLHDAMESSGADSGLLGAERISRAAEQSCAVLGGGTRVASMGPCVCWCCCCRVPQELLSGASTAAAPSTQLCVACGVAGFWSSFVFPVLPFVQCRHAPYGSPLLSSPLTHLCDFNRKEGTLGSVV